MALKYYKELGYGEINKFLREASDISKIIKENPSDYTVRQILEIDSHMSNNGELRNTLLYKGMSGGFIPMSIEASSGVIINKSYVSSSLTLDSANEFVSDDGCCVICFTIPDNIKYYKYGIEVNKKDREQEILIERNTQFVINVEESNYPVYYATLSKWVPPQTNDESSGMSYLTNNLSVMLSKRCSEIGEEEFYSERKKVYISEGEPEDDAHDLAEADAMLYCP